MSDDSKCKAETKMLIALQRKHKYILLQDTGKTQMVRDSSNKIVPYIVVQFAVPSDSSLGKATLESRKFVTSTRKLLTRGKGG